MKKYFVRLFVIIVVLFFSAVKVTAEDGARASTPMTTTQYGKGSGIIAQSTFRIMVLSKNISGTAFIHKSGKIITAAHIVENCLARDIILVGTDGQSYKITKIVSDSDYDLALLTPEKEIKRPPLEISSNDNFPIGMPVSTWGFPAGYKGVIPLLSVGYLAGVEVIPISPAKLTKRWIINAAFNQGNSGGPLIDITDGTVIGVVVSKLAPMPPKIEQELEVLKNQKYGFIYEKTNPDGTKERISEGQIIADILQYLRSQTQLVIGQTVILGDVKEFLKKNGIEP